MRIHDLKCWPEFYEAIENEKKKFELTLNDRNFQVGDQVVLKEWSSSQGYSGRQQRRHITYILDGFTKGLKSGYVILGF